MPVDVVMTDLREWDDWPGLSDDEIVIMPVDVVMPVDVSVIMPVDVVVTDHPQARVAVICGGRG
jgi:hypothetical protein